MAQADVTERAAGVAGVGGVGGAAAQPLELVGELLQELVAHRAGADVLTVVELVVGVVDQLHQVASVRHLAQHGSLPASLEEKKTTCSTMRRGLDGWFEESSRIRSNGIRKERRESFKADSWTLVGGIRDSAIEESDGIRRHPRIAWPRKLAGVVRDRAGQRICIRRRYANELRTCK